MGLLGQLSKGINYCKNGKKEKEKNYLYNDLKGKSNRIEILNELLLEKNKYSGPHRYKVQDLLDLIKYEDCPIDDDDSEILRLAHLVYAHYKTVGDTEFEWVQGQVQGQRWDEAANMFYPVFSNAQLAERDNLYKIINNELEQVNRGGKKRKYKRKTNKRKTNKRKTNKRKTYKKRTKK